MDYALDNRYPDVFSSDSGLQDGLPLKMPAIFAGKISVFIITQQTLAVKAYTGIFFSPEP